MIKFFADLTLPAQIQHSLDRLGFIEPTPVQLEAIPVALMGQDVVASAQTGTGKTLGFVVPMLAKMLNSDNEKALILLPTRELALQVLSVINDMLPKDSDIETVSLIGGDPLPKQINALKRNPRIIVGTPGRINDHIERKTLRLSKATFLVLDETDRMLDMGFGSQIESIIERMDENRQTLMFSATLPEHFRHLAEKYTLNPEFIEIAVNTVDVERIKQEFIHAKEEDKSKMLLAELNRRKGLIIVFAKTKKKVERVAEELKEAGHKVGFIHGDLKQSQREGAIRRFTDNKFRVLVATDVAARGLDIPFVEHVINNDLPQDPEEYIHRIGRTGRAGAKGSSITFVSGEDKLYYFKIQKLLDPEFVMPKKNSSKRLENKRAIAKSKVKTNARKQAKDKKEARNQRAQSKMARGGKSAKAGAKKKSKR